MDKTLALLLAGGILLVVGATMGEDGPVTQVAKMDATDAQQFRSVFGDDASIEPGAMLEPYRASTAQDFGYAPSMPAPVEVVHPTESVRITREQQAFDPAVAAASPIQ